MELRRVVFFISCLGWPVLVSASYNAPEFTLSHTGSQAGFTNSETVTVTVQYPLKPHSGTLWCITQDSTLDYCQSNAHWTTRPAEYTLAGGDGVNAVYLEYKYGGTVSSAGQAQIIVDLEPPGVVLFSPNGLPGALAGGLQQTIYVNPQFVTGTVSDSVPDDPVTLAVEACTAQKICTEIDSITPATAPFVWPWPPNMVTTSDTYIQLRATNAAGGTSSTAAPNPVTVFQVAEPGSQVSPISCSTSECPTLAAAESTSEYMTNDPPSKAAQGITFTGYADPSVRRDPELSPGNPNGTNLWMLYSYPEVQTNKTFGNTSEMVEVHLAFSTNSGTNWQSWCTPQPCSQKTPMWPSYHWLPAKGQPEQFSSHEVANFWPYSSDNVHWKWYAVHLMYFVQPPNGIEYGITNNGCLVTTEADAPYNLGVGWTGIAGPPPSSCSAQMPLGSQAISYATLNTAAAGHIPGGIACVWGEPAIMVQNGVAYMAASCFNSSLYSYGYFIFQNTLDGAGGLSGPWSFHGGPYEAPVVRFFTPKAQFVTEFDWAQRSDGSLVAVVSPASIANQTETQYGCVALEFSLSSGFGTAILAVNDTDAEETQGPNACAYEPTSNNGILIVRRLLNGANYESWSIVSTGLMP